MASLRVAALLQAAQVVLYICSSPLGPAGANSGSSNNGGAGAATGDLRSTAQQPAPVHLPAQPAATAAARPPGVGSVARSRSLWLRGAGEWLLGHGCAYQGPDGPDDFPHLWVRPAYNGDLTTRCCLRRMGVPWPQGLLPVAARGKCPLPVATWMVDQRPPVDVEVAAALKHARYQCQVSTLRWLQLVWRLSGSGWEGCWGTSVD